jgi:hypothetical protein
VLAATGGLHVAWARGSSFPFSTRAELADAVVGTSRVPEPPACYAVAGALLTAAALVEGAPRPTSHIRRIGLVGVAGILALRGVLGLAGHTDLVAPGSSSVRFRRLDRRVYAPFCLALSTGAWAAFRRAGQSPGGRGCA